MSAFTRHNDNNNNNISENHTLVKLHWLNHVCSFCETQELISCLRVSKSWRHASMNSNRWVQYCLRTFNFPSVFQCLLEKSDCRLACMQLSDQNSTHSHRTCLGTRFANIFKTFCGGGEHEIYEVANITYFRETPSMQNEITFEPQFRRSFEAAGNTSIDEYSTGPNGPVYCHLDVSELKTTELLRTSDAVLEQMEANKSASKHWIHCLLITINKLKITDIIDEDANFPAKYVATFLHLFEKAVLKIDDHYDFLFIVYNTLKKINTFLRALVKKSEYVMNFSNKLKFQALTKNVFSVWNSMIKNQSGLFTRLELIAVNEFREDFGREKSDSLKHIYELFYFINSPKKWTLQTSSNDSDKKISCFKGSKYACEFLLKVYELTLGSILFANLRLIVMSPNCNKLPLFSSLLIAFKEEISQISLLHRGCPSKKALLMLQKKIIEYVFKLNTNFGSMLASMYKFFSYTEDKYLDCVMSSNFVRYKSVPVELEAFFPPEQIQTPSSLRRFNTFLHDHREMVLTIVRDLNDLASLFMKNEKIQRVVTKYREKNPSVHTSSSHDNTGSSLYALANKRKREESSDDLVDQSNKRKRS